MMAGMKVLYFTFMPNINNRLFQHSALVLFRDKIEHL